MKSICRALISIFAIIVRNSNPISIYHSHFNFQFELLKCLMKGKWIFRVFHSRSSLSRRIFPRFSVTIFRDSCNLWGGRKDNHVSISIFIQPPPWPLIVGYSMVIGALEKCVLLMCEENRVCESLMARVKRFSPSSGTGTAIDMCGCCCRSRYNNNFQFWSNENLWVLCVSIMGGNVPSCKCYNFLWFRLRFNGNQKWKVEQQARIGVASVVLSLNYFTSNDFVGRRCYLKSRHFTFAPPISFVPFNQLNPFCDTFFEHNKIWGRFRVLFVHSITMLLNI